MIGRRGSGWVDGLLGDADFLSVGWLKTGPVSTFSVVDLCIVVLLTVTWQGNVRVSYGLGLVLTATVVGKLDVDVCCGMLVLLLWSAIGSAGGKVINGRKSVKLGASGCCCCFVVNKWERQKRNWTWGQLGRPVQDSGDQPHGRLVFLPSQLCEGIANPPSAG